MLRQHIIKNIEEEVHMILLENQCWAESDWSIPTAPEEDAFVSGLEQDPVTCGIITGINGTEGPLSSGSTQYAGVLSL